MLQWRLRDSLREEGVVSARRRLFSLSLSQRLDASVDTVARPFLSILVHKFPYSGMATPLPSFLSPLHVYPLSFALWRPPIGSLYTPLRSNVCSILPAWTLQTSPTRLFPCPTIHLALFLFFRRALSTVATFSPPPPPPLFLLACARVCREKIVYPAVSLLFCARRVNSFSRDSLQCGANRKARRMLLARRLDSSAPERDCESCPGCSSASAK